MGSGLTLAGNFASYEGGFINNIKIKDNIFLGSSLYPNGNAIQIMFNNKITQSQWITDITVHGNAFIGTGGETIKIKNAKNIILDGNIVVNPLRYTAISSPSMSIGYTAFTGSNVANISILDNFLFEKDIYTTGNRFFDDPATLSNNVAYRDPGDNVKIAAYNAYAGKNLTAQEIFNITKAEAIKVMSGIQTSIPVKLKSKIDIFTHNRVLSINGLEGNNEISIYCVNGILVSKERINSSTYNFDFSDNNLSGVFIIKGADFTRKIISL